MTASDVTSIPPRGLSVEVLAASVAFSASAGVTGLSALSPQDPPSTLLLLGWPLLAIVGGVLLDQQPGVRLGRTLVAVSMVPVVVVLWSVARFADVEAPDLAAAMADLAAPLGCVVATAVPWAFLPRHRQARGMPWFVLAGAGGVLAATAHVDELSSAAHATGWALAVVGTLGTWLVVARAARGEDRRSRRRTGWVLVTMAALSG